MSATFLGKNLPLGREVIAEDRITVYNRNFTPRKLEMCAIQTRRIWVTS